MFQKNSFANLCVMGWGFFRICCWKTDSYLNGFQTVVLEKGTLEEQYQLQSVSECVCVCPLRVTHQRVKSPFSWERGLHRPDPRLAQAPARAVCGQSRAVHSNQFHFSLQQPGLWEELLQPTRGRCLSQRTPPARGRNQCSTGEVCGTSRASYFLFLFSTCL